MKYLEVKDHSVSKKTFELHLNEKYDMLETKPAPTPNELPEYYKSDDYISHTDSKRNLLEIVYHQVRSIALKRKLNLINKLANKGNLLDIGCGTGDFIKVAQQSGWNITGIEPDEHARAIANNKTNNAVHNLEKLNQLPEKTYDIITLWHVLEHLPNLKEHIQLFKKLLKPDGTLIIAVPNYKSYDAHYYKEFWAAYDVPRHLWHFSKKSIALLFSEFGMMVKKIVPMKFDAYYVCLLSEKYKKGKMNPIKAFYIGFRSNLKAKKALEYSSHIYIIKNSGNPVEKK